MGFFDNYNVVDLSMMIEPHWRFNPDFRFKETPKQAFTFRSTVLQSYGAHNFSHCDAPQHVDRGMETIETMDIRRFSGDACLIDVSDLGDEAQIDWEIMETRSSHLRSGDIVLIRSNHADRHPTTEKEYWTKSPWITKTGAEFLRKREIKAVAFDFPQDRGIRADYLDGFHPAADPAEDWACHMLLLTKGIVQIEYLGPTPGKWTWGWCLCCKVKCS